VSPFPYTFPFYWDNIQTDLLSHEADKSYTPYIHIQLTKTGYTTYNYYTSGRVLEVSVHQDPFSDNATVVLRNNDQHFKNIDLRDYKMVINWGLTISGSNYTVPIAPQWVVTQTFHSEEGVLTCELYSKGILSTLADEHASGEYTGGGNAKSIVDEILNATLSPYSHCATWDVIWHGDTGLDGINIYAPSDAFIVDLNTDRLTAARQLIDFGISFMRPEADGKIHMRIPKTSGTDYDHTFALDGHVFFWNNRHDKVLIPNRVSVRCEMTDQWGDDRVYTGEASEDNSYKDITFFQRAYDLQSNDEATAIAQSILNNIKQNEDYGEAEVPISFYTQICDYIKITDVREGGITQTITPIGDPFTHYENTNASSLDYLWNEDGDEDAYNCDAQTFIPDVSYYMSGVELYLARDSYSGEKGNVKASIYNTEYDSEEEDYLPAGSAITSKTIDASTLRQYLNWAQRATFTSTAGDDGAIQCQYASINEAGTITGGSRTISPSNSWGIRAFALLSVNGEQANTGNVGTGSGTTGNPTPSYPSYPQEGDLFILQVTVRDLVNTPDTPAGWTILYGGDSNGIGKQWLYYKFATGSETGTITVTIGGSSCKMARIYMFNDVKASDFYEACVFVSGTGTTISAPDVATTGDKELAVAFVFVTDDVSLSSFTGEPSGDWIEFEFDAPISLTEGVTYALLVEILNSEPEEQYLVINYGSPSGEGAGGTLYYRNKYGGECSWNPFGTELTARYLETEVSISETAPSTIGNIGSIDWHFIKGKYRQVLGVGGWLNRRKLMEFTSQYIPEPMQRDFPYWITVNLPATKLEADQFIVIQTIIIPHYRRLFVKHYSIMGGGTLFFVLGDGDGMEVFNEEFIYEADSYHTGSPIDVCDSFDGGGTPFSFVVLAGEEGADKVTASIAFDTQYLGGSLP